MFQTMMFEDCSMLKTILTLANFQQYYRCKRSRQPVAVKLMMTWEQLSQSD